jgi:hypothetical protein
MLRSVLKLHFHVYHGENIAGSPTIRVECR